MRASHPLSRRSAAVATLAWLAGSLVLAPRLGAQWTSRVTLEGGAFSRTASDLLAAPRETEGLVSIGAGWSKELNGGRFLLSAAPLLRLDPSGERSRIDLLDLSASVIRDRWDLTIGMRELAWGAVESRRLVDGVNQRDLVGGGEGYVRLGQLTADFTVFGSWGSAEFLLLPWFRERRFDGHSGRLWSPLAVDEGESAYGPGAGGWGFDWAVRWSRTFGAMDIGLSHLQGTLREPTFIRTVNDAGMEVLAPRYDPGSRTGLEAQAVTGPWIWKLEALTANPESGRYLAAVGGTEYGIGGFLGVFLEYAWDSRGGEATTSFGNDVFAGARLFLPDGQVRLGTFVDTRSFNTAVSVDVDWRIGSATTLGGQVSFFLGDESAEPTHARRLYTCFTLRLSRYF